MCICASLHTLVHVNVHPHTCEYLYTCTPPHSQYRHKYKTWNGPLDKNGSCLEFHHHHSNMVPTTPFIFIYMFSITIFSLSSSLPSPISASQHLTNSTCFTIPLTSCGGMVSNMWFWFWPKEALTLACVHPMHNAHDFLVRHQVSSRMRSYISTPPWFKWETAHGPCLW